MTIHDLTLIGILILVAGIVAALVLGIVNYARTGKPSPLSQSLADRVLALENYRPGMDALESGYQTSSADFRAGVDFTITQLQAVEQVYPNPAIHELIRFLDDLRTPGVPANQAATVRAVAQMTPPTMADKSPDTHS